MSIHRRQSERAQMDLDENAYAVYTVLEGVCRRPLPQNGCEPSIVSLTNFPIIGGTIHQSSQLRRMFYVTLRPIVGAENLIEATNGLLELERI